MFKGGTWDKEDKFDLEINQEIKKMVEKEQISKIIVEHKELDKDRFKSSLEIGSSAKNCCLKVYFDATNKTEAMKLIDDCIFLRSYMIENLDKKKEL